MTHKRMTGSKKKITVLIVFLAVIALTLGGALWNSYINEWHAAEAQKIIENQILETKKVVLDRQISIKEAKKLLDGYYYDEAATLLLSVKPFPAVTTEVALKVDYSSVSDEVIADRIAQIEKAKASLTVYKGPMHHIFFHSLIIYPKLAFDNKGRPAEGYNNWMVTVSEFNKMLPELRDKGYVLYSLDQYSEPDPENPGKIRPKEILLPPGKKPLVISIDDVSYYDYMRTDGFANKLVAGSDGKIYTEVTAPDGSSALTRDGDVMPILDDFVALYPDFSWRGAKGTIALTGYEGALGYRISTLPEGPELDLAKTEAKKAADVLRKNGWLFACHSFTHNSYFKDYTITMKQIDYDTTKWKKYIEPIVGKTNLYITPFGIRFKSEDPRLRYLVNQGFNVICPVGSVSRIIYNKDNMIMSRANIDGYAMHNRPEELTRYYFDVSKVLDPSRPGF